MNTSVNKCGSFTIPPPWKSITSTSSSPPPALGYRRNRYSTQVEHLATKHRFLAEWSPEFFISRGQQIAPEVGLFMERLMEAKSHPEQGYKACSGC